MHLHGFDCVFDIKLLGSQPPQFPCIVPKFIIHNICIIGIYTFWQFLSVFLPVLHQLFVSLFLELCVGVCGSALEYEPTDGFALPQVVVILGVGHDQEHLQRNVRMLWVVLG
jgi:hypothetical protein